MRGKADKGKPIRQGRKGDAKGARGGRGWGVLKDTKREQEVGVAMAWIVLPQ